MECSFMVREPRKYPSGAKNKTAKRKLDTNDAKSWFFKIFSKKFCKLDVDIAKSAAMAMLNKKGAYKKYIP